MGSHLEDAGQIAEDVRALLRRKADEYGLLLDVPGAVHRARRRLARNAVVVLVVVAVAAMGTVAGIRSFNLARNHRPAQTPTLPPVPAGGGVQARISVPRTPVAVAVGEGAVWVAGSPRFQVRPEEAPSAEEINGPIYPPQRPEDLRSPSPAPFPTGTLTRIDPATNQVTATIDLGGDPYDVVAAFGGVWIADLRESRAVRVDPHTNRSETVPLPTPVGSVAAANGSLWFTSLGSDSVFRVDPQTYEVVADIAVGDPENEGGQDAEYKTIFASDDAVWVGVRGNTWLVHIDPTTNQVITRFDLELGAYHPAVTAEDGIWMATGCSEVVRIDPSSGEVVARVPLNGCQPKPPDFETVTGDVGYVTVVTSPGSVWVAVTDLYVKDGELNHFVGLLFRIDPSTSQVVQTIQVGESHATGPTLFDVAVGDETAWVIDVDAAQLVRVGVEPGS